MVTCTQITQTGTIKLKIYDDDGVIHDILIPNSYYVPMGQSRLLSPQHWAQQANDTFPFRHGTWCATYNDCIICYWNQQKHKVTVRLDPGCSNVGTIDNASGVNTALHLIDSTWPAAQDLAFNSLVQIPEIVPDLYPPNNDDHGLPLEKPNSDVVHVIPHDDDHPPTFHHSTTKSEGGSKHESTNLDPDRPLHILQLPTDLEVTKAQENPNKSDETEMKNRRLLKWWHERLAHISMHTVQHMAALGLLPSSIAKCKIPTCQGCMFGTMTRKPCITKSSPRPMSIIITAPGDCVSVDQL
jgi:hypothetical protein